MLNLCSRLPWSAREMLASHIVNVEMGRQTPLIDVLDALFRQDPDIDELGIIFSIPPPATKTCNVETPRKALLGAKPSAPAKRGGGEEEFGTSGINSKPEEDGNPGKNRGTIAVAHHHQHVAEAKREGSTDAKEPTRKDERPKTRGQTETKGQHRPADARTGGAEKECARESAIVTEPQFIVREHKLGVSVHSIHPLINEAREAFPLARREYLRARRQWLDDHGKSIGDGCRQGAGSQKGAAGEQESAGRERTESDRYDDLRKASDRLSSVTRALLLVNADHGSAWNARKGLVQDGRHGSVRKEIKLLDLIFTKHAKSPNAWAHRRWCWRLDKRLGQSQGANWRPLAVDEELKVCERVADLYPKNYYAWTQRSWIVLRRVGLAAGHTAPHAEGTPPGEETQALLESELVFVDKWLTGHVSDHSALNHRKNVASALAAMSSASGKAGLGFVRRELASSAVVIRDYPGHESLWCYRRFVCQAFLVIAARDLLLHLLPCPWEEGGTGLGGFEWVGWAEAVRRLYQVYLEEDDHQDLPDEVEDGGGEKDGEGRTEPEARDCIVPHNDDERASSRSASGVTAASVENRGENPEYEDGGGREENEGWNAQGYSQPPTPPGEGNVAEFLGQEARFALKCATDKGAWQFRQQRRHALAHLAFISYAASRIFRNNNNNNGKCTKNSSSNPERARNGGFVESGLVEKGKVGSHESSEGAEASEHGRERQEGVQTLGGPDEVASYCEVMGAPTLTFPLEKATVSSADTAHSNSIEVRGNDCVIGQVGVGEGSTVGREKGDGGIMLALQTLNGFVAGLMAADADASASTTVADKYGKQTSESRARCRMAIPYVIGSRHSASGRPG